MRVIKNEKGEFAVNDDPMHLTGRAAAQLEADLARGTSTNPAHSRVLAECKAAAAKTKR